MRTCPDCHTRYGDEIRHCPEDGHGLVDLPAEDELIGRTVGSYRVERLLGKGGMGSVYLAVHPKIGSRVAIKFLHPQFAHDRRVVERFYNEARAVNVIGHDNILEILDLDVTDDGRHYFVMELLRGRPLQALLRKGEPVPLHTAGPILLQVCDALEAAHRKGIVHRDLKPDNVHLIALKGKKNFVKVVDFGIAHVTDESGLSSAQTQTGLVMGTPAYMSPEQGSGAASQIDGRSDIYSLGVIMFQLATGSLPFSGGNFGEVLVAHLQHAPPKPRSLAPGTPEAYEAIILRCLEKWRGDRFASMREVRVALEQCMSQLGISADLPDADGSEEVLPPPEPRTPSSPGPQTPGPRKTLPTQALPRPLPATVLLPKSRGPLFAAIGVAAAAAIAAGAFFFVRRPAGAEARLPGTPQRSASIAAETPPVPIAVDAEPSRAPVQVEKSAMVPTPPKRPPRRKPAARRELKPPASQDGLLDLDDALK